MKNTKLLNDIRALSSGTINSITRKESIFSHLRCESYDVITSIHRSFVKFAENNCFSASSTWQDVWAEFLMAKGVINQ